MRIIGWILTVLGFIWAFFGVTKIIAAAMGAISDPGVNLVLGLVTLCLAIIAIWAGRRLRHKATLASASDGS
jgi:hypothetical protein